MFAGLRILAVTMVVFGLLGLVFQLLNSWSAFDPSYLAEFLASTVLKPLIVIITGLVLLVISGRLAKSLAGHPGHS